MTAWFQFVEGWMVQQLLRTPAFHRAVEQVARNVHRIRYGPNPEEMGGTKIEHPSASSFIQHFIDEIKAQLGQTKCQATDAIESEAKTINTTRKSRAHARDRAAQQELNADAVWQEAQKGAAEPPTSGFIGEYIEVLREQVRRSKPSR